MTQLRVKEVCGCSEEDVEGRVKVVRNQHIE